jgi:hypothetical protein
MKGKGDRDFIKWAKKQFDGENSLATMVQADQGWITELIRSRSAVEHPGGHSGALTIQYIRAHPQQAGSYISPTRQRTGNAETDILKDMDCSLDNLFTFGETH